MASAATQQSVTWIVTGTGGHLGSHTVRELPSLVSRFTKQVEQLHLKMRASGPSQIFSPSRIAPSRVVAVYHTEGNQMLPLTEEKEKHKSETTATTTKEEGEDGATTTPSGPFLPFELEHISVNLTDPKALSTLLSREKPSVFIHCAAYSNVNYCHQHPDEATVMNVNVVRNICLELKKLSTTTTSGTSASSLGCIFLHASTDMVFDGTIKVPSSQIPDNKTNSNTTSADSATTTTRSKAARAQDESQLYYYKEGPDNTCPLSEYGRGKVASEEAIKTEYPQDGYIIRCPLMFGVAHSTKAKAGTFYQQLVTLQTGQANLLKGFCDEWRTPASFQYVSRGMILLALLLRVQQLHKANSKSTTTTTTSSTSSTTSSPSQEAQQQSPPPPVEPWASHIYHFGGPKRLSRLEMLQELKEVVLPRNHGQKTKITSPAEWLKAKKGEGSVGAGATSNPSSQKPSSSGPKASSRIIELDDHGQPIDPITNVENLEKKFQQEQDDANKKPSDDSNTNPNEKSSTDTTMDPSLLITNHDDPSLQIQSISRHSIPSAEPRPQDLSMCIDKLTRALLLLQLGFVHPTPKKQSGEEVEQKKVDNNTSSADENKTTAMDKNDGQVATTTSTQPATAPAQASSLPLTPALMAVGDSIRLLAQECIFSQSVKEMMKECVEHYKSIEELL